jgi:L-lactate dehydrogenase complex protein LldG
VYCESEVQLMENLLALIEERGLRKIHVWEPAIQAILDKYELPYYPNDEDMMEMEVGITTCEALVARQGSVMVSSANAGGRRLTIFPETHVVIAHSRQLVLDIKDALAGMQRKYGAILPSSISFITGPSRTADIEKTLVFGAHGPKALYVFLMDY